MPSDDRKIVKDTSVHPSNGIGFVLCKYTDPQTGKKYSKRGTGFIIAQDTVLTALHVIYFNKAKDNKN
jgi:V8-like Glu-specific endopeptidase